MGAGRFICVALPLILTTLSIITLLYAALAGVTHENLRLFRVDLSHLSISPIDAGNLADKFIGLDSRPSRRAVKSSNITSEDLGLDDFYDVTLWGFCSSNNATHVQAGGEKGKTCTPHEYNWADKYLNTTNFATHGGVTIEFPKDIVHALKAFRVATKWAEILFVAALVALGVQLVIGVFSTCSRIVSCLTWLESGIATVLVCAAAALATAMSLIVVGAVDATAKLYGVHASADGGMLATVWLSAAFAIASSLAWVFTICCCKPERRGGKARGFMSRGGDAEKLLPGGGFMSRKYEPLDGQNEMSGGKQGFAGNARSDLAYEPYSHRV